MEWPYHFVDLTREQVLARRQLLDRYGIYAQLSALVPVAAYQLLRLAVWVSSERKRAKSEYTAVPSSPTSKKASRTKRGSAVKRWRAFSWWLGGEFVLGWGKRGQWIAGLFWYCWLLFLCSHETGDDYLHLTKRFGVVAASQFPMHYALSMKDVFSPLAIAFRASHEELNPYHRISGRIIYSLLLLHGSFYFNFFVQKGLVIVRFTSLVPLLGVTALLLLTILAGTSLARVRHWSYRLFIVIHGTIALVILPILFFHSPALRIYVVEAAALIVLDMILRKLNSTFTAAITITAIPHTNIVKLEVPIPASKVSRFTAIPAQHIYVTLPPGGSAVNSSLHNPFTIASVSTSPPSLTLFLRTLSGPMTKTLHSLSRHPQPAPHFSIEGPYGSTPAFPPPTTFDRTLLIAGGIGATFILPLYHSFAATSPPPTLIWAVRSIADASWATLPPTAQLYLTGTPSTDGVEMADLRAAGEAKVAAYKRPDLSGIVDTVFRMGAEERVAVVVCGPRGMAEEVRAYVGRWAGKGRDVWWHNEYFGF